MQTFDEQPSTVHMLIQHPSAATLHDQDVKTLESQKKPQKFCRCFKSRRSCLSTVLPLSFLFIVLIALAVFFLFPRIPSFKIGTPYATSAGLKYNTTAGKVTAVSYDLSIDFTVTSQNYWTFYTSSIATTANLLDLSGQALENAYGGGSYVGASFPRGVVTYSMPLRVYWVTNGGPTLQDPALITLKACTLNTPPETLK